jgi:adenosine kinase
MGSLKIAEQGPQNHYFSQQELAAKFQQAFGYSYL